MADFNERDELIIGNETMRTAIEYWLNNSVLKYGKPVKVSCVSKQDEGGKFISGYRIVLK